eukprot:5323076-Prymnesium_polylepis.1
MPRCSPFADAALRPAKGRRGAPLPVHTARLGVLHLLGRTIRRGEHRALTLRTLAFSGRRAR